MQFDTLRQRREDFGFSVDEVARESRLSAARVEEIEMGREPVYLDELTRLGHALAFEPAEWLRGGDLQHPRRAVARFRSDPHGELGARDLRLMARATQLARAGEALRSMLGDPPSMIEELRRVKPVARGRTPPHRQGYALGVAARSTLAPDKAPLPSVQGLLEHIGVHVAHVRFESRAVDAVSLYEPDALPMILLNTHKARVRQFIPRRATLAHELCHLLHDARGSVDLLTLISWSGSREPEEQRANGFAPAFLAPPAWLGDVGGEPVERVRFVGQRWGLSAEGAVWHCKNARLIEADTAEYLSRNLPKVERDRDLEAPPVRRSPALDTEVQASSLCRGLISDLVARAIEGDHISRGRARELLEWG